MPGRGASIRSRCEANEIFHEFGDLKKQVLCSRLILMKPCFNFAVVHFRFEHCRIADTKQHDFKGAAVAEVYKEASGDKLWIYRFDPVDYKPESDSRPAVVFFFGGGWNGGNRRAIRAACKIPGCQRDGYIRG